MLRHRFVPGDRAIVVGVSASPSGITSGDLGARHFAKFLQDELGVPQANVLVLTSLPRAGEGLATPSNLWAAFRSINDLWLDKNRRLYFYFGGHTVTRPNGEPHYELLAEGGPSRKYSPRVQARSLSSGAYVAREALLDRLCSQNVRFVLGVFDTCSPLQVTRPRARARAGSMGADYAFLFAMRAGSVPDDGDGGRLTNLIVRSMTPSIVAGNAWAEASAAEGTERIEATVGSLYKELKSRYEKSWHGSARTRVLAPRPISQVSDLGAASSLGEPDIAGSVADEVPLLLTSRPDLVVKRYDPLKVRARPNEDSIIAAAQSSFDEGDFEGALSDLDRLSRKLRNKGLDLWWLHYFMADCAFHLRKPILAGAEIDAALALAPKDLDFPACIDDLVLRTYSKRLEPDRLRGLLAMAARASQLSPKRATLLTNTGVLYRAAGDSSRARDAFEQAVKLPNPPPQAYFNLGILLNDAAEQDPRYAHPASAADNANRQQVNDRIENAYRQALGLDPDYVNARYNLAVHMASRGRFAEAKALYEHILRTHPKFVPALRNLADMLPRMISKDKMGSATLAPALAYNLRAFEASSSKEEKVIILLARSTMYANLLDDHVRERSVLRQVLRIDADNAKALSNLAASLYAENQAQPAEARRMVLLEARGYLERAVRASERYLPAWINLGLVAYELTDFSAAEAAFRRARALDPKHGPLTLALATAVFQQGPSRLTEARSLAEEARSLMPNLGDDPDYKKILGSEGVP